MFAKRLVRRSVVCGCRVAKNLMSLEQDVDGQSLTSRCCNWCCHLCAFRRISDSTAGGTGLGQAAGGLAPGHLHCLHVARCGSQVPPRRDHASLQCRTPSKLKNHKLEGQLCEGIQSEPALRRLGHASTFRVGTQKNHQELFCRCSSTLASAWSDLQ